MLIQVSPTNVTFTWIYPYKYWTPTSLPSISCSDPINSCSTTWRIPRSRYPRRPRVMVLSGFNPLTLSIYFINAPDIREILELEMQTVLLPASFCGSTVIDITRNCQVIQVYSSLVRSSDLKISNQNNNLLTIMIIDDPTTNYCRSVEDICIPMITRFDRLMFVFCDMEGNIMRLSGEFEPQLMIEDMYDQVPSSIPPINQFSMIEVFGNTTKKEVKLDNPLLFD